jgi:uncharacterized protein YutE (UPF0331/DUF86 family)
VVDRDIILAKVATIERCLRRIQDSTDGKPGALDDFDHQDVFVLNLQRAAQAAIDIAQHLVAAGGFGLPGTLREGFAILEKEAGLDRELSVQMQHMVGFRNIAVHDYQELSVDALKAILVSHLDELRAFASYALGRAREDAKGQ